MTFLLLAASLLSATYHFGPTTKIDYDANIKFDGFVPVMGGMTGNVEVKLGVSVNGLEPDTEGNARASSELTSFKLLLNGALFPMFRLDNVVEYLPKTTVSMTPQGKVLKTDAPDVPLPVSLPLLDAKRFPDITYLPIEFPVAGIEVGKEWTFTKKFGSSDVSYAVKPTKLEDDKVTLEIKLKQTIDALEDEALVIVKEESAAISKVHTQIDSSGTGTFDLKLGAFLVTEMKASSVSKVTDIKTSESKERKLTILLSLKLRTPPKVLLWNHLN